MIIRAKITIEIQKTTISLKKFLNPYLFSPIWQTNNQKKPLPEIRLKEACKEIGGDLLSRGCAVPSARLGLTSLFGMGRGDPQRYNHQNIGWTTFEPI